MLMKCANPDCLAQFKYGGEGQFFEFCVDGDGGRHALATRRTPGWKTEIYWLCTACARHMTIEVENGAVMMVSVRKRTA